VFPAINKVDVRCKGSVAARSEDQTPALFILGAQLSVTNPFWVSQLDPTQKGSFDRSLPNFHHNIS
jgi:hypothetical protein